MMYKVIISGANSFIGMELTKQLSCRRYTVYALVREGSLRKEYLEKLANVKVIFYKLEAISEILQQIPECCDTFIHLAWAGIRGEGRNDRELQYLNVKWTENAFEAAKRLGCSLFITAGSQAEYGSFGGQAVSEETECHPVTAYGIQKLNCYESLMERARINGMRLIEPRFFSIYGPYDYSGTLIMDLIRKMSQSKGCDLTEASQQWDYLYISDAADAIIRLMEIENTSGVYNVASGQSYALRGFIEVMKEVLKSNSILRFGAIPYPSWGRDELMVDVSLLKKTTGWKPEVSFRKGITLTHKYLESMGEI